METLNYEVQSIVHRFKRNALATLSDQQREKLRLEKERLFSLNEKLYNRTGSLRDATNEEVKQYKKNTDKLEDLKNILIQEGASE